MDDGGKLRSNSYWKDKLTPEQYRVAREKGTERPFSGEYHNSKEKGLYTCICCGEPLFTSEAKYDPGCGWPSYTAPVSEEKIETHVDASHGMVRTEVCCQKCGAHLGHVFDDGPGPTGQRYCINSVSLKLKPNKK